METNFGNIPPIQRQRRSRLEPILLLSFILCLLIGSGALAAMVWLQGNESRRSYESINATIDYSGINPQLALRQLTGDASIPLAYQALEAGELHTATAIFSFNPQIRGRERAALYYRLARRISKQGLEHEFISLYETMRNIAVLDPTLNPNEQIQLLLSSSQGFIANDLLESALTSAQQAKRVAAQTPDILPAQRSRDFEALLPLAKKLDDAAFLQQIKEFERNPYIEAKGVRLSLKLDQIGERLQLPTEIADAVSNRQQVAARLVDQLTSDEQALSAALMNQLPVQQALAEALLLEDQARTARFRSASAGDSTLSLQQQLTLLEDQQSWLAFKTRVANRGFGIPLVIEWEQQLDSIAAELAGVTQNIDPVVEALMNLELSPQTKAALRVEKLQRLALLTELGLYPGRSAGDFAVDLRFAQDEVEKQGLPLALPVFLDQGATPNSYQFWDAVETP